MDLSAEASLVAPNTDALGDGLTVDRENRLAAPDLPEKAPAGSEIIAKFVSQVIGNGDLELADALINEGLQGNGPLYGLGWGIASVIAEHEGPQAIGIHQQQGPVHFFIHGAEFAAGNGEQLVSPDVILTLKTLEEMIQPR